MNPLCLTRTVPKYYFLHNVNNCKHYKQLARPIVALRSTSANNSFFQGFHTESPSMFLIKTGMLWKVSQILQEDTCLRVSPFMKMQAVGLQFYQEETPAQVFVGKFWERFQNNFFIAFLCSATFDLSFY